MFGGLSATSRTVQFLSNLTDSMKRPLYRGSTKYAYSNLQQKDRFVLTGRKPRQKAARVVKPKKVTARKTQAGSTNGYSMVEEKLGLTAEAYNLGLPLDVLGGTTNPSHTLFNGDSVLEQALQGFMQAQAQVIDGDKDIDYTSPNLCDYGGGVAYVPPKYYGRVLLEMAQDIDAERVRRLQDQATGVSPSATSGGGGLASATTMSAPLPVVLRFSEKPTRHPDWDIRRPVFDFDILSTELLDIKELERWAQEVQKVVRRYYVNNPAADFTCIVSVSKPRRKWVDSSKLVQATSETCLPTVQILPTSSTGASTGATTTAEAKVMKEVWKWGMHLVFENIFNTFQKCQQMAFDVLHTFYRVFGERPIGCSPWKSTIDLGIYLVGLRLNENGKAEDCPECRSKDLRKSSIALHSGKRKGGGGGDVPSCARCEGTGKIDAGPDVVYRVRFILRSADGQVDPSDQAKRLAQSEHAYEMLLRTCQWVPYPLGRNPNYGRTDLSFLSSPLLNSPIQMTIKDDIPLNVHTPGWEIPKDAPIYIRDTKKTLAQPLQLHQQVLCGPNNRFRTVTYNTREKAHFAQKSKEVYFDNTPEHRAAVRFLQTHLPPAMREAYRNVQYDSLYLLGNMNEYQLWTRSRLCFLKGREGQYAEHSNQHMYFSFVKAKTSHERGLCFIRCHSNICKRRSLAPIEVDDLLMHHLPHLKSTATSVSTTSTFRPPVATVAAPAAPAAPAVNHNTVLPITFSLFPQKPQISQNRQRPVDVFATPEDIDEGDDMPANPQQLLSAAIEAGGTTVVVDNISLDSNSQTHITTEIQPPPDWLFQKSEHSKRLSKKRFNNKDKPLLRLKLSGLCQQTNNNNRASTAAPGSSATKRAKTK